MEHTNSSLPLPITALITTYNVEHCIEACLKSLSGWLDEILVVDSFSTDRTLEIVSRYTPNVLQHEYISQAAQCNWAIPRAKNEWVLLIDSDEVVSPELRQEIIELFRQFESIANEYEGVECWSARELSSLLGYVKWDKFCNATRRILYFG